MELESEYDLIIVGSGVAGLSSALNAKNKNVLVITKTLSFTSGSSPLAQGGIAASVGEDDTAELHYQDTIEAGVFSARSDQVSFLTNNGVSAIDELIRMKMPFDTELDGKLGRNREGAHSRRRVLKAGGDATGKVLVKTLYHEALKQKNIKWKSETFVQNLIVSDNQVHGVLAYTKNEGWVNIYSPRVILATGGLGQLFGHTTNPIEATGDSMAIALRAGLKLKEVEMVQFHPTALNIKDGNSFKLLTEALRGDGGILVIEDGTAFMGKYSPKKDLAPRDVVARAIWSEMELGNKIFLDLKGISNIKNKFPTVTSFCLKAGLNPLRELIPITPAVHYVMGGVDANSSLPLGLGVAGEAAYTGVHGANRLASNSLLECLVYGKSESERVLNLKHKTRKIQVEHPDVLMIPSKSVLVNFISELQSIMFTKCGIIREESSLLLGIQMIDDLTLRINDKTIAFVKPIDYTHVVKWLELKNMLVVGRSLIGSAIYRKESRGAHYRSDYPNKNSKWDRVKIRGVQIETISNTV